MGSTVNTVVEITRCLLSNIVYGVYSVFFVLIDICNEIIGSATSQGTHDAKVPVGYVLWKRKKSVLDSTSPKDFMCLYLSYVDPDYVLGPNVSLYSVTKTEAIFVETPEDVNIYNSDENPFVYVAQFERCRKVIKLPIKSFHKLAEKIGDPAVPVTWFFNTGRCGSTILCQVLETVPGTLVMSEQDAPQNVFYLLKAKQVSNEECNRVLRSTVRLVCKPHPGTKKICIKPRPFFSGLMMNMVETFPDFKYFFMYRNCRATVSSWLGIMISTPQAVFSRFCIDNTWISAIAPHSKKTWEFIALCNLKEQQNVTIDTNTIGLLTHMWAHFLLLAREAITCYPKITPVKYEDILSEPKKSCKKIFEGIGIDLIYLNAAVSAFNRDSHRGTVFDKRRISNDPRRRIFEADISKADKILSGYNLPHMGENILL